MLITSSLANTSIAGAPYNSFAVLFTEHNVTLPVINNAGQSSSHPEWMNEY